MEVDMENNVDLMDVEEESQNSTAVERCSITINDLPDEVLEYILSLISAYKDMKECMLVCRRWYQSVKNVSRVLSLNLTKAIKNLDITWESLTPVEMSPSITKRYSHSACYHDHSMYVFGGCTSSSTTFNDLWRLDLTKRQWVRPLTMGTYPSPKACASMVHYKKSLVLFGGWTHPSPYPLYQAWRLFNELHIYSITSNRWTCINTSTQPPSMAGHSASVHGNTMVVFGGLKSDSVGHYTISNDLWCFDLEIQDWKQQVTSDPKPTMRYGQSQIPLDKEHILIMGGCGGPNMVLSDMWLLTMVGDVWQWREITVVNPQWSAPHMWCHPACRVGEQVVVLSRHPTNNVMRWNTYKMSVSPRGGIAPSGNDPVYAYPKRYSEDNTHSTPPIDRDLNVNGRRGSFNVRHGKSRDRKSRVDRSKDDTASTSGGVAKGLLERLNSFNPDPKNSASSSDKLSPRDRRDEEMNSDRNPGPESHQSKSPAQRADLREKRQENLRSMEERLNRWERDTKHGDNQDDRKESNIFTKQSKIAMAMYVLDISRVLEDFSVTWLALRPCGSLLTTPEETILYTLVAGKGELIMFGGIQKDAMSVTSQAQTNNEYKQNNVSNSLHFISAPRGVI